MLFKKNQEITATVLDLTSQGQGVLKPEGYTFFVERVIPGELVRFKVIKQSKKFGYGRLLEVIEPSPDRVALTDPVGRQVGTMTLQHMSYPAQLKFKQQQVQNALERIGGFEGVEVKETIGADSPWGYRNKAQIPVREIDSLLQTGFYRQRSHDLVPIENFYIQDPVIDQVIVQVRDIMRDLEIPAYKEEDHSGVLRHIIVKRGHHSGQIMIVLVTRTQNLPQEEAIVARIVESVQGLVSLVHNIHPQVSNVILGPENRILWGQDYYEDSTLGLDFKIGVHSFYQVNTPQAERLYQEAIDQAGLTGKETVLDAYCGIGTLSLALAREAGQVYAMEIVDEAIQLARQNADRNQIENVHFETGAAEDWLPRWNEAGISFDVIVIDPPRKGLDESFIEAVIEQAPGKIVYVSCNPQTQARDCHLLAEAGYEIQSVQPVDLFAMTPHIESVVLMERTK